MDTCVLWGVLCQTAAFLNRIGHLRLLQVAVTTSQQFLEVGEPSVVREDGEHILRDWKKTRVAEAEK